MADENGRISVSEDKLYRALAEQELRIIEGVSEQIKPLDERVAALELERAGRDAVIARQEKHQEIRALTKPGFISACVAGLVALGPHLFK